MFLHLVIHHPKPEYVDEVLASMRRVADSARGLPGLVDIGPWHADADERLLGFAIWKSEEAFTASHDAVFAVTEGDDFELWLARPSEGFRVST